VGVGGCALNDLQAKFQPLQGSLLIYCFTGRLDRFLHLLLDDHLESLGRRAALCGIGESHLLEEARIT
jgi:hypothetical protein